MERLNDLTIIIPAYEQPQMLSKQLVTWGNYDEDVLQKIRFIVVDDCSPTTLTPVIKRASANVLDRIHLYRMTKDVAWNRNICRNAAASVATSRWLMNADVDHVLPAMSAKALFETEVDPSCWYRFPRFRVGRADETRRKDALDETCVFGPIKSHIDSHLMTRELFMSSPYDPEYTGFLGGGSPFLARLQAIAPVHVLPDSVPLHVYTRHAISDASIFTLDRDTSEYKRRRKEKDRTGNTVPKDLFQHEWERIL